MKEVMDMLLRLDERLDSVDKTLVRQEIQLAEHIRRTELLEHATSRLEEDIYHELQPLKEHVARVGVIGKLSLWLVPLCITIAFGVLKYVI